MKYVYNESVNFIESYSVHLASMPQRISVKWCQNSMMPPHVFITHEITWYQAYVA